MEFRTHFGSMSAAVLAIVGTTTFAHADEHGTTKAFTQELSGQYRALAEVERLSGDYRDADRYAARAQAAAAGTPLAPTEVNGRTFLKEQYAGDLSAARNRLVGVYERRARNLAPAPSARAESSYECWLEQAAEDLQPEHIAACRDAFMLAMNEAEKILDTPVAVAEPPPPPPAPAPQPEIHRVYFEFNKSSLTGDATAVLARVREIYDAADRASIEAIGWADTVGSDGYNQTLSRKRAEAVKRHLIDIGIPGSAISTDARGEDNLPKPTADGVREPRNRQVEVTVTPEV